MPGLVNAHCHLDYTHMAGQIPPPTRFSDWLKIMVETKAGWSLDDYRASWKDGAQMLVRTGTTTVADIEALPDLLPECWETTPLRVISFLEMIGITNRRTPQELLAETARLAFALPGGRWRVGLAPHAPYSTLPELLRRTGKFARKRKLLVATHVAESDLEFDMFTQADGTMFDWLQRSGRDMADCGLGTPVQHLARTGFLGPNLIAAHVNYLGRGDAVLLGRRNVSVAHCPRSHHYFQHAQFPLRQLTRARVNVCLGTDSLATVYKRHKETVMLDMFAEMRALRTRMPWVAPRTIIRMATVHGAKALDLDGEIGQLSPGACADVIALPCPATTPDIYAGVLSHEGPVLASMIQGRWALPPAT